MTEPATPYVEDLDHKHKVLQENFKEHPELADAYKALRDVIAHTKKCHVGDLKSLKVFEESLKAFEEKVIGTIFTAHLEGDLTESYIRMCVSEARQQLDGLDIKLQWKTLLEEENYRPDQQHSHTIKWGKVDPENQEHHALIAEILDLHCQKRERAISAEEYRETVKSYLDHWGGQDKEVLDRMIMSPEERAHKKEAIRCMDQFRGGVSPAGLPLYTYVEDPPLPYLTVLDSRKQTIEANRKRLDAWGFKFLFGSNPKVQSEGAWDTFIKLFYYPLLVLVRMRLWWWGLHPGVLDPPGAAETRAILREQYEQRRPEARPFNTD